MSKRWLVVLAAVFSTTLMAYGQIQSIVVDQDLYSGQLDPRIIVTNTSNPNISTLETYLQNLPPTGMPNWPISGPRGFRLQNNNVPDFNVNGMPTTEVRVFQGVIRIFIAENQYEYFVDTHGLESFLSIFFGPPSSQGEKAEVTEDQISDPWLDTIVPFLPTNGYEPLYNPLLWNTGNPNQWNNNCYNYAANKKTGTFAQPGRRGGRLRMGPPFTCSDVLASAIADGLVPWVADVPCSNNDFKVALVVNPAPVAPPGDFHWLRQDRGGNWSQKFGGDTATNLDNAGNPITDPRTANRGGYTVFCAFMCVRANPNNVNIGAPIPKTQP